MFRVRTSHQGSFIHQKNTIFRLFRQNSQYSSTAQNHQIFHLSRPNRIVFSIIDMYVYFAEKNIRCSLQVNLFISLIEFWQISNPFPNPLSHFLVKFRASPDSHRKCAVYVVKPVDIKSLFIWMGVEFGTICQGKFGYFFEKKFVFIKVYTKVECS